MLIKGKMSRRSYILFAMFLAMLTLLYIIVEIQFRAGTDAAKSVHYLNSFNTYNFPPMEITTVLQHLDKRPPNNWTSFLPDNSRRRLITDDIFIPPNKSQKAYLSAIKRLSFKKITPSSLRLEQPYFQPDPNNRFEMLDTEIISPPECSGKTKIVVLILSEPKSTLVRKTIRETWGSVTSGKLWPLTNFKMDIQLLFIVGVPSHSNTKRSISQSTSWDNSQLRSEAVNHNDILQFNSIDSYSNLTRKVILGFKWIDKNCPKIRYVLKADQDIFVNLPLVWHFLLKYGQNNSIYGHMYFSGKVNRGGKWGVSRSVLPIEWFPAYASGTSYAISFDAIGKVLRTYYLFPYVNIEDAFITGIVGSVAKIDRYHVKGFTCWTDAMPDSCELVTDRIYTANGVNVTSMAWIWNDIEQGGGGRC